MLLCFYRKCEYKPRLIEKECYLFDDHACTLVVGRSGTNVVQLLIANSDTKPPKKASVLSMIREIKYEDLDFDRQKDFIGGGSFGNVYKGQWKTHFPVAIKEISGTLDADTKKHFDTEAEVMMRANNSWVVRLHGIAKTEQRAALVMELMPESPLFPQNVSLKQLLRNGQELSWTIRYQIAEDIAHGLYLLHGDGIFHRDLKSDNVLLDDHLRAKLSDFGLSKIKSASRSSSRQGGQSVGTVAWTAPELFQRKAIFTEKADIYSLGVTLWEMAARKMPFSDAANVALIPSWVSMGDREDIPDNCPAGFKSVIEEAWKQKPEERLALPMLIERLHALHTASLPAVAMNTPRVSEVPTPSLVLSGASVSTMPLAASPEGLPNLVQRLAQVELGCSTLVMARSKTVATATPTAKVLAFQTPSPVKTLKPTTPSPDPQEVSQFLELVAQGWQDRAEAMLKRNPSLVLARGTLNDLAGRKFEGVDPEIARLGGNGVRALGISQPFNMHCGLWMPRCGECF